MKVEYKNVNELIPYVNNPRDNENAIDSVASSIKNFGFKVPIVIDRQNEIINGHTRLKAAKKLGMVEVPVIIADDLTEDQIKAFRLADNKTSELATWNEELLISEIETLIDNGVEIIGFSQEEIDALFASFDYDEVGGLEDYENPADEFEEEEQEQCLKCPHCGHIENKALFEKASKSDWEKVSLPDPEIRFAEKADLDGIKKIADSMTNEIGFVLRGALEEAIGKHEVLVALDQDKVVAFANFHVRKDNITTLYEIATFYSYRGNGIAKKLIDQMPKPIQLKCPVGNSSNNFYENIGAIFKGEVAGKKRPLNTWEIVE